MGIINDLGLDESMTKEQVLNQLFAVRKKLISRQNSADAQKRTAAELQLDILSSMQNAIDKMSQEFPNVHIIIGTYGYSADNEKLNKDLKAAIEDAVAGNGDAAGNIADFLGNNGQELLGNEWMFWAANCGAIQAYQVCGYLLTDTNPDDAIKWFEKAEQANAIGASNIYNWGLIFYRKKEYAKAKDKFERASAEGHTRAPYFIAEMYENGYGVAKDLRKALEQYQLAKQRGLQDAQQGITRVTTVLNQQNASNTIVENQSNSNTTANNVQNGQPTLVFKSDRKTAIPNLDDINIYTLKEKVNVNELRGKFDDLSSKIDKDKIKKLPWKKIFIGVIAFIVIVSLLKSCANIGNKKTSSIKEQAEEIIDEKVVDEPEEEVELYTKLAGLQPTEYEGFQIVESANNTLGDSLRDVISLYQSSYSNKKGYAKYYLNKKYKVLIFDYSCMNENIASGTSAEFSVYMDENIDPSYINTLTRSSELTTVNLDVSECSFLTLSLNHNNSSNSAGILISNAYLFESEEDANKYMMEKIGNTENTTKSNALYDMTPTEENGFSSYYSATNSLGNELIDVEEIYLSSYSGKTGYITYYIKEDYEDFVCNISCKDDNINSGSSAEFSIYVDNKEDPLFINKITRSSEVETINIDVSGAKYITFKLVQDNSSNAAGVLISDAMFFTAKEETSQFVAKLESSKKTEAKDCLLYEMTPTEANGYDRVYTCKNSVGDELIDVEQIYLSSYSGKTGYLKYYLQEHYSNFVCDISCMSDNIPSGSKANLSVFVDTNEDPIYQQTITRSTELTTINLDVTNAKYLLITLKQDNSSNAAGILLSDATLLVNYSDANGLVEGLENKKLVSASDTTLYSMIPNEESGYTKYYQVINGNGNELIDVEEIYRSSYSGKTGYIRYYLRGNYKTFSCSISSRNDDIKDEATASFWIVLDNNSDSAYETTIRKNMDLTNVELDVTGCRFITFYLKQNNSSNAAGVYISDAELKVE